jgi:hypothetical protein
MFLIHGYDFKAFAYDNLINLRTPLQTSFLFPRLNAVSAHLPYKNPQSTS